jgi:uncharacterized protein
MRALSRSSSVPKVALASFAPMPSNLRDLGFVILLMAAKQQNDGKVFKTPWICVLPTIAVVSRLRRESITGACPWIWRHWPQFRIGSNVYTDAIYWDEPENRSNWQKHGISFDTATQVFLDTLHISPQDRIAKGEERWQTIGTVNGALLVLAACTVVDEKGEVIRFISARKVTRQERIEYEEANEI